MRRYLPHEKKEYIILLLLWLFIGFSLGTALLLGPLRTAVTYARSHIGIEMIENLIVMELMVYLAIISYLLSFALMKKFFRTHYRSFRLFILLIPCIAFSGAAYILLHPDMVNANAAPDVSVNTHFIIGPYPDEAKLRALKKEGFTGVITLLNPEKVPFETKLFYDEKAIAEKLKLELISAPMVPWVSENSASLSLIKDMVKKNRGKYYIHCYLGKDRVNSVKQMIDRMAGEVHETSKNNQRTVFTHPKFERGSVIQIDDGIFFTPEPTDEEFLIYILSNNYKQVVSLLDPSSENKREWVDRENKLLGEYNMKFYNIPITATMTDADILKVIDTIRALPKPMIIHDWNITSPKTRLFLKLFTQKIGRLPLNMKTQDYFIPS